MFSSVCSRLGLDVALGDRAVGAGAEHAGDVDQAVGLDRRTEWQRGVRAGGDDLLRDWAKVMVTAAMVNASTVKRRIKAPSPGRCSQGGPVATREQHSHAAAEHAAAPRNVASRHRRR